MENILADISYDINRYLDSNQLINLSMVSTNSLFVGLNDIKYNRFIPSNNGEKLLMLIKIKNNFKELLKEIVVSNNVNFADEYGDTILIWATSRDNSEILNELIKAGADVNLTSNCRGTPLQYAAWEDKIDMVELLINAGADVNIIDKVNIISPLHWGISKNNIGIVELLINAGADVNAIDKNGETPLKYATERKYLEIVNILILAGGII